MECCPSDAIEGKRALSPQDYSEDELNLIIEGEDGEDGFPRAQSRLEFIREFLEQHYGLVEVEQGRPENFLICWYQRKEPTKVSKGDKFFYAFVGKAYLVIEVPCAFLDEVSGDDLLSYTAMWGRGQRGQARTFQNVVSVILVEEHPEYALTMMDQLIETARAFEASVTGVELPPKLLPSRGTEDEQSSE